MKKLLTAIPYALVAISIVGAIHVEEAHIAIAGIMLSAALKVATDGLTNYLKS